MPPQQQRMAALTVRGPYTHHQQSHHRPSAATTSLFDHLHPVQRSTCGGARSAKTTAPSAPHTKRPLPSFAPAVAGPEEGMIVNRALDPPAPPRPQQQHLQHMGHHLDLDDTGNSRDQNCIQQLSYQQQHQPTANLFLPTSSLTSSLRENLDDDGGLLDSTQNQLGHLSLGGNGPGSSICPPSNPSPTPSPVISAELTMTRSVGGEDGPARHVSPHHPVAFVSLPFHDQPRTPVEGALESDNSPLMVGSSSSMVSGVAATSNSSSSCPVSLNRSIVRNDRACLTSTDETTKTHASTENPHEGPALHPIGPDSVSSSSSFMMEQSPIAAGVTSTGTATSRAPVRAPSGIPCGTPDSRKHFLVFIKILFKVLDQANEVATRNRARQIVTECTRKNRMGDPHFVPLMEAVEKRLQLFVRPAQWWRAHLLWRHYCASTGAASSPAPPPSGGGVVSSPS
jgi:hypothetical protein